MYNHSHDSNGSRLLARRPALLAMTSQERVRGMHMASLNVTSLTVFYTAHLVAIHNVYHFSYSVNCQLSDYIFSRVYCCTGTSPEPRT